MERGTWSRSAAGPYLTFIHRASLTGQEFAEFRCFLTGEPHGERSVIACPLQGVCPLQGHGHAITRAVSYEIVCQRRFEVQSHQDDPVTARAVPSLPGIQG